MGKELRMSEMSHLGNANFKISVPEINDVSHTIRGLEICSTKGLSLFLLTSHGAIIKEHVFPSHFNNRISLQ